MIPPPGKMPIKNLPAGKGAGLRGIYEVAIMEGIRNMKTVGGQGSSRFSALRFALRLRKGKAVSRRFGKGGLLI